MGRRLCVLLVLLYIKPADVFKDDEPAESELAAAARSSLAAWSRDAQKAVHRRRHRRDEEMVCFESLGCFRDEGPFDYLDALPQSPESVGTKFMLTTRRNPTQPEIIHYSNMTIPLVMSTGRRPLKVIIHGFGSSCRRLWAREMKQALLKTDDINILCVEWESGASLPNYVQAAANTKLVGRQLALLIGELTARGLTDPSQVHLIGFSLGAHVAGFTGKQVANISRISGLDPAAPLFEGYGSRFRLDPSDARFVDVIHSNGDRLLKGGLGAFEPMGHVDFYPNGGKAQAGCNNLFVGALSDLFLYRSRSEEDSRSLCNHRRAYKFFTESIDANCHMRGFACSDFERFLRGKCFSCGSTGEECGDMGIHADQTIGRGKFYLITRDAEPLCVNQFKVEISLVPRDRSTSYGLIELILSDQNGFNESIPITSESEEINHKKNIVKIIAANPLLSFAGHCQIQYVAYNGWLYRGGNEVLMNKLAITDSYGRIFSLCSHGIVLQSGIITPIFLTTTECNLSVQPLQNQWTPVENDVLQNAPPIPLTSTSIHRYNKLEPIYKNDDSKRTHLFKTNNFTYQIVYPSYWSGKIQFSYPVNMSLLVLVPPTNPNVDRTTRMMNFEQPLNIPISNFRFPMQQTLSPYWKHGRYSLEQVVSYNVAPQTTYYGAQPTYSYYMKPQPYNRISYGYNRRAFQSVSPFAGANHLPWNAWRYPMSYPTKSDLYILD